MDRSMDVKGETSAYKHYSDIILYKHRWVVLLIFSLISMSNEVIWISLSSITSIVREYYGVSYVAVNWLSMIYMLFYVFVVFAAYILDRYGLKFTITLGATLNGLGSCLRLIGTNRDGFLFTFIGNALAALAQCFILFVPPSLAATWFGEKERATASSVGVLMNMLGVAIGFLMGGTMVPSSKDFSGAVYQGLFNTLIVQAVFCTFMVVCCVLVVHDSPKSPPSLSQKLIIQSRQEKRKQRENKRKECIPKERNKNRIEAEIPACDEKYNSKQNKGSSSKAPISHAGVKILGFVDSLKLLARDRSFHCVSQAYGLYFGLFAAYNTILNQMCIVYYPGKEKEIGLMGFTSVLLGLVGIFLAGVWLDKTKKYKAISIATFACCSLSLLVFTLLLVYVDNFKIVYSSFCIFGFFSYPYMTVGLEHAAELTYPISEGITSGILLLYGNMYGILLTFLTGAIIERGRSDIAGYVMTVLYIIGLIFVFFTKGHLKRHQADISNSGSNNKNEEKNLKIEIHSEETVN